MADTVTITIKRDTALTLLATAPPQPAQPAQADLKQALQGALGREDQG